MCYYRVSRVGGPISHNPPILIHLVPQSHEAPHMWVSFYDVMEKIMKSHSCRHHIWCDGKSKFRGHKFGSLERALTVLKFSSPSFWK